MTTDEFRRLLYETRIHIVERCKLKHLVSLYNYKGKRIMFHKPSDCNRMFAFKDGEYIILYDGWGDRNIIIYKQDKIIDGKIKYFGLSFKISNYDAYTYFAYIDEKELEDNNKCDEFVMKYYNENYRSYIRDDEVKESFYSFTLHDTKHLSDEEVEKRSLLMKHLNENIDKYIDKIIDHFDFRKVIDEAINIKYPQEFIKYSKHIYDEIDTRKDKIRLFEREIKVRNQLIDEVKLFK